MSSVNKCIFIGRVGRDPEVRTTQGGQKVVSFSLACSETWKDRQSGERKERTDWIPVVIWNERLADVAERFVRKGGQIMVEGSFQTRKWTDQSGQERYTTECVLQRFRGELVLLSSKNEGQQGGQGGQSGGYSQNTQCGQSNTGDQGQRNQQQNDGWGNGEDAW